MKMKSFTALLLATVLSLMSLAGCSNDTTKDDVSESNQTENDAAKDNAEQKELQTVTFGLQTATNSLPFYIAQKEGFFAEEGINAEFSVYTSGGAQIEAAASDAWMFGTGGVFPAITGMLNLDLNIIGSCMSDDAMVDLWVRADSPIAKSGTGHCEEYPSLYGTKEDWEGITVLGPVNTTGHYCLVRALSAFGLSLSDVNVTNMEVNSANTAFKAGEGDAIISWLSLSVDAAAEGWVKAATLSEVGADAPSMIFATKQACKDPELVEKVLKVYYRTSQWITENLDQATDYYYDLLYNNGVTATKEECRAVLDGIPYHTLEESQHYMNKEEDGERYMMKCFDAIMQYLISQGSYTNEDLETIKQLDLMPDEYINAVSLD